MDIIFSFCADWWWVFLSIAAACLGWIFYQREKMKPKPGEVQAQFILTAGCLTIIMVTFYVTGIISSIVAVIGWIYRLTHHF